MAALWGRSDGQLDDARAAAVAAAGVGVARIPAKKSAEEVGALLDALRRRYRIDQGGLHALVGGEGVTALAAIAANRHQFQTVTTFGDAAGVDLGLAGRMRGRRVRAIGDVAARALGAHVAGLHAARALRGEQAAVARALDSFHDAAAVADGARYFALFPADAVFLGTDASERWSGAEFRTFAARYSSESRPGSTSRSSGTSPWPRAETSRGSTRRSTTPATASAAAAACWCAAAERGCCSSTT